MQLLQIEGLYDKNAGNDRSGLGLQVVRTIVCVRSIDKSDADRGI